MKHAKLVRPKGSKNKNPRPRGGPLVDLILRCLHQKQLSHAELFDRVCERKGFPISPGAFCGVMFRLREGPYKRIYVARWERNEGPGRRTLHRVYARGNCPDAPKLEPFTQTEKQRERRQRRRKLEVARVANSSIFALAASMQTSQNRHSSKGPRRCASSPVKPP